MSNESQKSSPRLRFAVCEDGDEYIRRFERFLGSHFEFLQARDFGTLLEMLDRESPVTGLLLDLDFRRTPTARLVDDNGTPLASVNAETLKRLIENQGIAILSALRKRGWTSPVLLFADIDEPSQIKFLIQRFAPVQLVPSHLGLNELTKKLSELGA